jgi:DNA-binding response OmpR family regulator/nitrogen-specific signal transduction histidine kinase
MMGESSTGSHPDGRELAPRASARAAVGGSILVADDNVHMRTYLTRLLGQRWAVEAVPDGEAALKAAKNRAFDLVVADVMMPRVDGFGLLRSIRSDPELSTLPVIMISAGVSEDARIAGLEAGADDYLVKPFDARELLARVSTRVALRKLGMSIAPERLGIHDVFAHAPIPLIMLHGEDLVVEMANSASIAGSRSDRNMLGVPLLELAPELAGQAVPDLLREVMRSGVPYTEQELMVKLQSGDRLVETYWNVIFAPLRAAARNDRRVIAIYTEVTEQVEARKKLEALTIELETASRTKDEFLAMLGHELRNPLSPILTALELMRLRGHYSREQDIIERQISHLTRLVDDLLDVSRITRGKVELKKRRIEIAEIVARSIEVASPLLEQRAHRLEIELPRRGLAVDADVDRLAQVFANLLTNAAKYSDHGSRIVVAAERGDGVIRVRVRDFGIGIAPDMIGKVFGLFVQESQSLDRSRGGLGLGLAIAKNLVEMHKGTVAAFSEGPATGTEMVVELPAAYGDAPESEAGSDPDASEYASRKRILVVDDNDDAATMLKFAFEELGYVVEIANDGPSALRIAKSFRPDVALLDIGLPVMDGYELAGRLLEQRDPARALHLVAVTGYGQEADLRKSAKAGFEDHLVKPVDLRKLERVVKELVS